MRSGHSWSGRERNVCFVNKGEGTFSDISYLSGIGFIDDARGLAALDWDSDGDLDIWMNNRSSPRVRYLRNDHQSENHYINLKLIGSKCNRDAIGARIEIQLPDRNLIKSVRAGANYSVQGSKWVHFGLGENTQIERVVIRWPDGSITSTREISSDAKYLVYQKGEVVKKVLPVESNPPLASSSFQVQPMSQTASVPLGARLQLPPYLEFTSFDNQSSHLSDFSGKPVLINLWASWCTPCLQELSGFVKDREILEEAGVVLLAYSVDELKDREKAIKFKDRLGFWFSAGMADDQMLSLIQVIKNQTFDRYTDLPMPTSLLIDSRGRLARIYLGRCSASQIANDVRAMASAKDGVDVLELATEDPTGIWHRPFVWSETQIGTQLKRMIQFCAQDGLDAFARFYAAELGIYLDRENRTASSVRDFSKAILPVARKSMETVPQVAEKLFSYVLNADPENVQALMGMTDLLAARGDKKSLDEASRMFETAIGILPEPTDSVEYAAYGNVLFRLGKPNEAVEYLEKAHKINPNDNMLEARLGAVLINLGQIEKGVPMLENAIDKLDPTASLESALASGYERLGQKEKAKARRDRIIEMTATATTPQENLIRGESFFFLNRWPEAVKHLELAVKTNMGNAPARLKLAISLANSNRDEEAIGHFEASVPNLEPNAASELVWGMALARLKQFDAAEARFSKVLEIEPDNFAAHRSLGSIHQLQGRNDKAMVAYDAYLERKPDDVAVWERIVDLAMKSGRTKIAVDAYHGILVADGSQDPARYKLAWLLAAHPADEIRNGGEALELAELLAEHVGRRVGVLDLLAAAHAENGDFEKAILVAKEGLALAATDNPKMVGTLKSHIKLYESGKPFRTQTAE